MRMPLEDLVELDRGGRIAHQVGKTFQLDEILEAYRCTEENKVGRRNCGADVTACGKNAAPLPRGPFSLP